MLGLDTAWIFANSKIAGEHYKSALNDAADFARVHELWERVIAQDPREPEVLHNAARFFWNNPPDQAKSIELAKRLQQIDPLNHAGPLASFLTRVPAGVPAEVPNAVRVGSGVLRESAVITPLPDYPQSSFRADKQGMVVAVVIVDTDGSVTSVEITESPDTSIAASVSTTLKRWWFKPFTTLEGNAPLRVTGRLVFYFEIREGSSAVIDTAAVANESRHKAKSN